MIWIAAATAIVIIRSIGARYKNNDIDFSSRRRKEAVWVTWLIRFIVVAAIFGPPTLFFSYVYRLLP
ncbi:hypothetical protein JI743_13955 [Sphingopyxis sp. DHUNG17]|uniref:hypothetical protein n=1 Tax=Sphingopyxis jiangsuensis TaxID=2871171 RepID=UPI00191DEE97|nr:hypothetical protein [Sphingopyxis lutea]MBL0769910.1 hypothetical protein [Sphingopyxis lutea]